MKCRDMAELVTQYMEGALPIGTRLSARVHLWLCGSCRLYLDQMRRTIRFLADGPPPRRLPSEVEDRIIETIAAGGPHDPGGRDE